MYSAFGVDHGEVSKAVTPYLVGGAVTGGVLAGGAGYANGRTGRSNVKQSKKMGRVGGSIVGGTAGLFTGGPIGAAGGAGAGYLVGGKAAEAGAKGRIKRKRNKD